MKLNLPESFKRSCLLAGVVIVVITAVTSIQYWEHQHSVKLVRLQKIEEDRLKAIGEQKANALDEQVRVRKQKEELDLASKAEERRRKEKVNEQVALETAFRVRHLGLQPQQYEVVILIVDENGKPNRVLSDYFVSLMNTEGFRATASLLSSEFIADGLFTQVFEGSKAPSDRLELKKYAKVLLLGRQEVSYVTNRALENLITANMVLNYTTIPLNKYSSEIAEHIDSIGAALEKPAEARVVAQQNLIKQLQTRSQSLVKQLRGFDKQ